METDEMNFQQITASDLETQKNALVSLQQNLSIVAQNKHSTGELLNRAHRELSPFKIQYLSVPSSLEELNRLSTIFKTIRTNIELTDRVFIEELSTMERASLPVELICQAVFFILKGDVLDWQTISLGLKGNFIETVLKFDWLSVLPTTWKRLDREFLRNPHWNKERNERENSFVGLLTEWVECVYSYFRLLENSWIQGKEEEQLASRKEEERRLSKIFDDLDDQADTLREHIYVISRNLEMVGEGDNRFQEDSVNKEFEESGLGYSDQEVNKQRTTLTDRDNRKDSSTKNEQYHHNQIGTGQTDGNDMEVKRNSDSYNKFTSFKEPYSSNNNRLSSDQYLGLGNSQTTNGQGIIDYKPFNPVNNNYQFYDSDSHYFQNRSHKQSMQSQFSNAKPRPSDEFKEINAKPTSFLKNKPPTNTKVDNQVTPFNEDDKKPGNIYYDKLINNNKVDNSYKTAKFQSKEEMSPEKINNQSSSRENPFGHLSMKEGRESLDTRGFNNIDHSPDINYYSNKRNDRNSINLSKGSGSQPDENLALAFASNALHDEGMIVQEEEDFEFKYSKNSRKKQSEYNISEITGMEQRNQMDLQSPCRKKLTKTNTFGGRRQTSQTDGFNKSIPGFSSNCISESISFHLNSKKTLELKKRQMSGNLFDNDRSLVFELGVLKGKAGSGDFTDNKDYDEAVRQIMRMNALARKNLRELVKVSGVRITEDDKYFEFIENEKRKAEKEKTNIIKEEEIKEEIKENEHNDIGSFKVGVDKGSMKYIDIVEEEYVEETPNKKELEENLQHTFGEHKFASKEKLLLSTNTNEEIKFTFDAKHNKKKDSEINITDSTFKKKLDIISEGGYVNAFARVDSDNEENNQSIAQQTSIKFLPSGSREVGTMTDHSITKFFPKKRKKSKKRESFKENKEKESLKSEQRNKPNENEEKESLRTEQRNKKKSMFHIIYKKMDKIKEMREEQKNKEKLNEDESKEASLKETIKLSERSTTPRTKSQGKDSKFMTVLTDVFGIFPKDRKKTEPASNEKFSVKYPPFGSKLRQRDNKYLPKKVRTSDFVGFPKHLEQSLTSSYHQDLLKRQEKEISEEKEESKEHNYKKKETENSKIEESKEEEVEEEPDKTKPKKINTFADFQKDILKRRKTQNEWPDLHKRNRSFEPMGRVSKSTTSHLEKPKEDKKENNVFRDFRESHKTNKTDIPRNTTPIKQRNNGNMRNSHNRFSNNKTDVDLSATTPVRPEVISKPIRTPMKPEVISKPIRTAVRPEVVFKSVRTPVRRERVVRSITPTRNRNVPKLNIPFKNESSQNQDPSLQQTFSSRQFKNSFRMSEFNNQENSQKNQNPTPFVKKPNPVENRESNVSSSRQTRYFVNGKLINKNEFDKTIEYRRQKSHRISKTPERSISVERYRFVKGQTDTSSSNQMKNTVFTMNSNSVISKASWVNHAFGGKTAEDRKMPRSHRHMGGKSGLNIMPIKGSSNRIVSGSGRVFKSKRRIIEENK